MWICSRFSARRCPPKWKPGRWATAPTKDNVHIQVSLADGSKGEILYLASGDASVPKERLEVFGRGRTAICEDFRKAHYYLIEPMSSKIPVPAGQRAPERNAVLRRRRCRESTTPDTFREPLGNDPGDIPDSRVIARRRRSPGDGPGGHDRGLRGYSVCYCGTPSPVPTRLMKAPVAVHPLPRGQGLYIPNPCHPAESSEGILNQHVT